MAKLFSKNQESSSQDAAVSSIPVPPADSALVIDLPEGQKLVLGKMEEGTVIEVATWRGTGRPDSRTNRLMLGVSFGGTQAPETKSEDSTSANDRSGLSKYQYLVRRIIFKAASSVKSGIERLKPASEKLLGGLKIKRGKERRELGLSSISTNRENEDFDIDKWLSSVRSNSRMSKLAENDSRSDSRSRSRTVSSETRVEKGQQRKAPAGRRSKNSGKRGR